MPVGKASGNCGKGTQRGKEMSESLRRVGLGRFSEFVSLGVLSLGV